jgi:fructose-1,6-bisphosphatase/inositol monophosphatase family enzyme
MKRPSPIRDAEELLARIRAVHDAIQTEVVAACASTALEGLSEVVAEEGGDTVFAIDRVSEAVLVERFAEIGREWPCLLIAEGLGADGRRILPAGTDPAAIEIAVIVDPIDGTRGLMYQKRPAWILTGVAAIAGLDLARDPRRVPRLSDIGLSVQTEIPLVKQHLADQLWAIAGRGARAERFDRISGARTPLALRPSAATNLLQGFGGLARFFPGGREELSAIDDALALRLLGPPRAGVALAFEDQYISTGGQLYELTVGHDRWVADLRPLVDAALRRRGQSLGVCSHPYDLCTELIAREAGVIVTDPRGGRLDAPLDVFSDVGWIGYANATLRDQITPVLTEILEKRGLIEASSSGPSRT